MCRRPGLARRHGPSRSTIGRKTMKKSFLAVMLAGSVSLSACATNRRWPAMSPKAPLIGAARRRRGRCARPGRQRDRRRRGRRSHRRISPAPCGRTATTTAMSTATSRTANIMPGTPQGYDPTLRRVATGALGGAALGAAAGAVIPGLGILEGAVIGAAVGGVAGAIWADSDNDGRVDGYMSERPILSGCARRPRRRRPIRPRVRAANAANLRLVSIT